MKKLQMEHRRRARRFLFSFILISLLMMLISPWLSMIFGLLLAGAAAYGLSPTMDMYRGFKSAATLSVISKNAAMDVYKNETKEVGSRKSQYMDLVMVIILAISIFIVSIFLLAAGWNGLIFNL